MADEDTGRVDGELSDDQVMDGMAKFGKAGKADNAKTDKFVKKRASLKEAKQKQHDRQKAIEQQLEDEDVIKRKRTKSIVEFQYYVDFVSIAIIGLVFFLTCISGLLNGVSQTMLALRAITSVIIASFVVFICRTIIMKRFHSHSKNEVEGENEGKEIDG